MKNMPYEPPQIFIEVTPGNAINLKAQEIDQSTHRIITPSLVNWSQYTTLSGVLEEARQCFSRVFPIYKIPVNQPTMTNTNVYGQPPYNRTNSFYGQAMAPGTNVNMSMPNPQQNLNNIYGIQPPMSNINVYGNKIMNNNPQTNYNQLQKQQPETEIKNILIVNAREKMEAKYLKERKIINQQGMKLNNYKNQFGIEMEKINNYLINKDNMLQKSDAALNDISNETYKLTEYNNANRGKVLTRDNFMNFIRLDDNSQKSITLIAKEACYEELLTLCKKGFEKQNMSFTDAVKFTRNVSRDLFSIRYKREKLLNKV